MINILLVPIVMGCALGGTVGLIKIIHHFFPGADDITKGYDKRNEKHN